MEINVWYSRISFITLFRALRMDPEGAIRLISQYWFPKNDNFTARVKQEFERNRERVCNVV
jgi:hypothetical protein